MVTTVMSELWETYACTMGDHQAWIVYDHGIRETIASLPYQNIAKFRVTLRNPDERGLPRGDEFAALNAIEDDLVDIVGRQPGVFVGRITVKGSRHLFFYTNADSDHISEIADDIERRHEREISTATRPDPQKESYWNELFPTDADWQVVLDLKTEDALRRAGDKLERPRKVRHYAYFTSDADRARFVALIGVLFDATRYLEATDSFGVEFEHVCCPDHASMNSFTVRLRREAKQCGGEYDGWETLIVQE
jgi:hypothetical protein